LILSAYLRIVVLKDERGTPTIVNTHLFEYLLHLHNINQWRILGGCWCVKYPLPSAVSITVLTTYMLLMSTKRFVNCHNILWYYFIFDIFLIILRLTTILQIIIIWCRKQFFSKIQKLTRN